MMATRLPRMVATSTILLRAQSGLFLEDEIPF